MAAAWIAPPLPLAGRRARCAVVCSAAGAGGLGAARCAAASPAAAEEEEEGGIVADGVCLWWPDRTLALARVSLRVPPGRLAMLVGPNGCGKSTLLHVLRGLLLPDAGAVRVGAPAAFVFQDPNTQLFMPSVELNVAMSVPEMQQVRCSPRRPRAARAASALLRARVADALRQVDLVPVEDYMPVLVRELSGGQKQRVAVAAALAMRPRVILFDEVTASMDNENRTRLIDIIPRIISENNIAALWVTHLRPELDIADDIYIMERGRIIACGTRDEMLPLVDRNAADGNYFPGAADDLD